MWETGCRWQCHIKRHPTEIGSVGTDLIHLAQDRDQWKTLVNMKQTFQAPSHAENMTS
jgi:hypothetical protein